MCGDRWWHVLGTHIRVVTGGWHALGLHMCGDRWVACIRYARVW